MKRITGKIMGNLALVIAALVVLLVTSVWFLLTQPMVWAASSSGVTREVDAKRLETHVRALSETYFPRDWTHVENLDKVAAYIAGEMTAAGGRVSEQVFEVEGHKGYKNVIGVFGPETGERIVVGAHYDSCEELPAADDNASGVAGLLELAVLLGETKDLPLRVDLVAYTTEEPPIYRTEGMGSWVHASSLKKEGVKVRAQITLEMIGYFTDQPNTQEFPNPCLKPLYPSTGNFISLIGKVGQGGLARKIKSSFKGASDLRVVSMNGPASIPGVDFSDHRSYWEFGYPALMVTDTAFYRNTRYHTAEDTPDTLDYPRMGKVVQGVYQAVRTLSK